MNFSLILTLILTVVSSPNARKNIRLYAVAFFSPANSQGKFVSIFATLVNDSFPYAVCTNNGYYNSVAC